MSKLEPFINPVAMLHCLKLELTDLAQLELIDRVILSLPKPPNTDRAQIAALGDQTNEQP